MRQQLRAQPLLNGISIIAVLFHETFLAINATGWGGRAGVEQLRAFTGLNHPITDRIVVETGYLIKG